MSNDALRSHDLPSSPELLSGVENVVIVIVDWGARRNRAGECELVLRAARKCAFDGEDYDLIGMTTEIMPEIIGRALPDRSHRPKQSVLYI